MTHPPQEKHCPACGLHEPCKACSKPRLALANEGLQAFDAVLVDLAARLGVSDQPKEPYVLADAIEELKQERDDLQGLVDRQAAILRAAANALKGEPPEGTLHSHHDVGELAAKLVTDLADAKAGELTMRREASAALDAAEIAVNAGKQALQQRNQVASERDHARAGVRSLMAPLRATLSAMRRARALLDQLDLTQFQFNELASILDDEPLNNDGDRFDLSALEVQP